MPGTGRRCLLASGMPHGLRDAPRREGWRPCPPRGPGKRPSRASKGARARDPPWARMGQKPSRRFPACLVSRVGTGLHRARSCRTGIDDNQRVRIIRFLTRKQRIGRGRRAQGPRLPDGFPTVGPGPRAPRRTPRPARFPSMPTRIHSVGCCRSVACTGVAGPIPPRLRGERYSKARAVAGTRQARPRGRGPRHHIHGRRRRIRGPGRRARQSIPWRARARPTRRHRRGAGREPTRSPRRPDRERTCPTSSSAST